MTLYNVDAPVSLSIVEAGDPEEMVTRLQAAIDAITVDDIFDLRLAGAGSGPLWQCEVVAADTGTGITTDPDLSRVVAVVGGDFEEVQTRIRAAIEAVTDLDTVNKIVIAGAGDGPTFMAVALVTISD